MSSSFAGCPSTGVMFKKCGVSKSTPAIVDLGKVYHVTTFIGKPVSGKRVETYKIEFSSNNKNWTKYTVNGEELVSIFCFFITMIIVLNQSFNNTNNDKIYNTEKKNIKKKKNKNKNEYNNIDKMR